MWSRPGSRPPVKICYSTRQNSFGPSAFHACANCLQPCGTKMKLTDEVFRSFRVAKVFRENADRVNCIDFSANGDQMIASSNDDSIVIYCCIEGRCALIRVTRDHLGVVPYAGLRGLYTVRSMAVICYSIHMHQTPSSIHQIK